jgi:AraC-like DNA-binding protein
MESIQPSGIEHFRGDYVPPDIRLAHGLQALIERHFRERREAEFYSGSLHISLKRLNRLTNHYHQKTVYQLLQERLHQEAELLLKHTTLSAKQVAFELGVCDPAHFSKCFKKITGMRPGEYRKRHQMRLLPGYQKYAEETVNNSLAPPGRTDQRELNEANKNNKSSELNGRSPERGTTLVGSKSSSSVPVTQPHTLLIR